MERIEHKQKGFGKRFLSVMLTLAMVLTMLPITAVEVRANDTAASNANTAIVASGTSGAVFDGGSNAGYVRVGATVSLNLKVDSDDETGLTKDTANEVTWSVTPRGTVTGGDTYVSAEDAGATATFVPAESGTYTITARWGTSGSGIFREYTLHVYKLAGAAQNDGNASLTRTNEAYSTSLDMIGTNGGADAYYASILLGVQETDGTNLSSDVSWTLQDGAGSGTVQNDYMTMVTAGGAVVITAKASTSGGTNQKSVTATIHGVSLVCTTQVVDHAITIGDLTTDQLKVKKGTGDSENSFTLNNATNDTGITSTTNNIAYTATRTGGINTANIVEAAGTPLTVVVGDEAGVPATATVTATKTGVDGKSATVGTKTYNFTIRNNDASTLTSGTSSSAAEKYYPAGATNIPLQLKPKDTMTVGGKIDWTFTTEDGTANTGLTLTSQTNITGADKNGFDSGVTFDAVEPGTYTITAEWGEKTADEKASCTVHVYELEVASESGSDFELANPTPTVNETSVTYSPTTALQMVRKDAAYGLDTAEDAEIYEEALTIKLKTGASKYENLTVGMTGGDGKTNNRIKVTADSSSEGKALIYTAEDAATGTDGAVTLTTAQGLIFTINLKVENNGKELKLSDSGTPTGNKALSASLETQGTKDFAIYSLGVDNYADLPENTYTFTLDPISSSYYSVAAKSATAVARSYTITGDTATPSPQTLKVNATREINGKQRLVGRATVGITVTDKASTRLTANGDAETYVLVDQSGNISVALTTATDDEIKDVGTEDVAWEFKELKSDKTWGDFTSGSITGLAPTTDKTVLTQTLTPKAGGTYKLTASWTRDKDDSAAEASCIIHVLAPTYEVAGDAKTKGKTIEMGLTSGETTDKKVYAGTLNMVSNGDSDPSYAGSVKLAIAGDNAGIYTWAADTTQHASDHHVGTATDSSAVVSLNNSVLTALQDGKAYLRATSSFDGSSSDKRSTEFTLTVTVVNHAVTLTPDSDGKVSVEVNQSEDIEITGKRVGSDVSEITYVAGVGNESYATAVIKVQNGINATYTVTGVAAANADKNITISATQEIDGTDETIGSATITAKIASEINALVADSVILVKGQETTVSVDGISGDALEDATWAVVGSTSDAASNGTITLKGNYAGKSSGIVVAQKAGVDYVKVSGFTTTSQVMPKYLKITVIEFDSANNKASHLVDPTGTDGVYTGEMFMSTAVDPRIGGSQATEPDGTYLESFTLKVKADSDLDETEVTWRSPSVSGIVKQTDNGDGTATIKAVADGETIVSARVGDTIISYDVVVSDYTLSVGTIENIGLIQNLSTVVDLPEVSGKKKSVTYTWADPAVISSTEAIASAAVDNGAGTVTVQAQNVTEGQSDVIPYITTTLNGNAIVVGAAPFHVDVIAGDNVIVVDGSKNVYMYEKSAGEVVLYNYSGLDLNFAEYVSNGNHYIVSDGMTDNNEQDPEEHPSGTNQLQYSKLQTQNEALGTTVKVTKGSNNKITLNFTSNEAGQTVIFGYFAGSAANIANAAVTINVSVFAMNKSTHLKLTDAKNGKYTATLDYITGDKYKETMTLNLTNDGANTAINTSYVTWKVTSGSAVTVDEKSGLVTAKAAGTAVVTGTYAPSSTSNDTITLSCTITVVDKVFTVENPGEMRLAKGSVLNYADILSAEYTKYADARGSKEVPTANIVYELTTNTTAGNIACVDAKTSPNKGKITIGGSAVENTYTVTYKAYYAVSDAQKGELVATGNFNIGIIDNAPIAVSDTVVYMTKAANDSSVKITNTQGVKLEATVAGDKVTASVEQKTNGDYYLLIKPVTNKTVGTETVTIDYVGETSAQAKSITVNIIGISSANSGGELTYDEGYSTELILAGSNTFGDTIKIWNGSAALSTGVTWDYDEELVSYTTDTGVLTPKKAGTATLTGTYKVEVSEKEYEVSIPVTVKISDKAANLVYSPTSLTIPVSTSEKVSFIPNTDGYVYNFTTIPAGVTIYRDEDLTDAVVQGNSYGNKAYYVLAGNTSGSYDIKVVPRYYGNDSNTAKEEKVAGSEQTLTVKVVGEIPAIVGSGTYNRDVETSIYVLTNYAISSYTSADDYKVNLTPTIADATSADIAKALASSGISYYSLNYDSDKKTGWTWDDTKTKLTSYEGSNFVYLPVTYTSDDYTTTDRVKVYLATLTGLTTSGDVEIDDSNRTVGKELTVKQNASVSSLTKYPYITPSKLTVKNSKEAVIKATLKAQSGNTYTYTVVPAGSTTGTAKLTFTNGKFSTSVNVSYVGAKANVTAELSIDNLDIAGNTAGEDDVTYYIDLNDAKLDAKKTVELKAWIGNTSAASKLTVKSSNTSAAKAGSLKAGSGTGEFVGSINLQGAGYTKISVTSNDKSKSAYNIGLYVISRVPSINPITINTTSTLGTDFTPYIAKGYVLSSITTETSGYTVTMNPDRTANIKTTLSKATDVVITGTVNSADGFGTLKDQPFSVTVKVKLNTKPFKASSIKATVTSTYNLFYVAADRANYAGVKFTCKEGKVTAVELQNGNGYFTDIAAGEHGSEIRLGAAMPATADMEDYDPALALKNTKKLTFNVTVEGYGTHTVQANIKAVNKKPSIKLSSKSATIYALADPDNNQTVYTSLVDSTKYEDFTRGLTAEYYNKTANLDSLDTYDTTNTNGEIAVEVDKDVIKAGKKEAGGKIRLTKGRGSEFDLAWADYSFVDLNYGIALNIKSQPKIQLSKKTITLNNNSETLGFESDTFTVKLSGGADLTNTMQSALKITDSKGGSIDGIGISFDPDGAEFKVSLDKAIKKGSYKFNVWMNSVKAPLTVKVVDTAKDKAVKLSAKGKIDVLTGNSMAVTPKITGYTGELADDADWEEGVNNVTLTGADAGYFIAGAVNDGVIYVGQASYDLGAYDLSRTYQLGFKLELDNGNTLTTPVLKFKVTQGKMTAAIDPTNPEIASGGAINVKVNATHTFNKMKLDGYLIGLDDEGNLNYITQTTQNGFVKLDKDTFVLAEDSESATFNVQATGAVRGKTYTVKYAVIQDGQAKQKGVLKPTTATIKIKIAK